MQFIFHANNFSKPLFTTYLNTSFFTVYLFGFAGRHLWSKYHSKKNIEDTSIESKLLHNSKGPQNEEKLTLRETMKLALMFCPLWFIDNYTFNLSLVLTSVSSNTILSSTSGLFTLLLSAALRVESFTIPKFTGVLVSFGGVVLVSLTDSRNSGDESLWGDLLAIFSAITYAIYVTLFKKAVKNEERVENTVFLGFMGFFNMLLIWPVLAIFSAAGFEKFELPMGNVILYLILNSLGGTVISDYFWLLAILLLSPVVATVGLSLTIPVAMISDMIFSGTHFGAPYIFGSILVAIGFIVVNMDKYLEKYVAKITDPIKKKLWPYHERRV